MDLYGPLPESKRSKTYILVVVDHLTKWPEAYTLEDKTSETICRTLIRELLPRFSMPRKILSDGENTLIAESIGQLWQLLGIHRQLSSAYHPQTNTMAERFNRFLGDALYASTSPDQKDWDLQLSMILFAYRSSTHPTTGESPYFLLYGTDPILPEDWMTEQLA
jgi:transposase InsO family protein